MKNFKDLGVKKATNLQGDKIKIDRVVNQEIIVTGFTITKSKYEGDCLNLQITYKDENRIIFTSSKNLMDQVQQIKPEDFPFKATILKDDKRYDFD